MQVMYLGRKLLAAKVPLMSLSRSLEAAVADLLLLTRIMALPVLSALPA